MASIIAECNRDTKKRSKPFTPKDFMYFKKRKAHRMAPDEMLKRIEALNLALGGKDKRRK